METYRRYSICGWVGIEVEEVREFLEDEYDRELPDDYEPTDDEWNDAAWKLLLNDKLVENIDDLIREL